MYRFRLSQYLAAIVGALTIGTCLSFTSPAQAQSPFDVHLKVNRAKIGTADKGEGGTIYFWDGDSYDEISAFVGALSLDVTLPVGGYPGLTDPFDVYCIDIEHGISLGTSYGGFVKSTDTYNAPFNTLSGGVAAYLYNTFASTVTTYQQAAGLQLAIWESLYDTSYTGSGQRGLDAGNFKIKASTFNTATITAARGYLDSWAGINTSTATWIDIRDKNDPSKRKQSMVGPAIRIPEPGTFALLALGGFALAGYTRRRVL